MTQIEALTMLVDWIRGGCSTTQGYGSFGYDVYIPHLIDIVLRRLNDSDNYTRNHTHISSVMFDAGWELCRRGILRPGVKELGGQITTEGNAGAGYTLTPFGKKWIHEGNYTFVPTEPERFAEMLEPFKNLFGEGYFERAQQAIRCYDANAYLACCAMCGAASESILLATAIKKLNGEEEHVLKQYRAANGRKKIEDIVIGRSSESLKKEFAGLTSLLKYWRDEAAHGLTSNIGDNEAYTSLIMLLRCSMFVNQHWQDLTG